MRRKYDISPIETMYQGVLYRSRTEARWAAAFNAMGLVVDYEPEGYDIGGIWYVPDFLLTCRGGLCQDSLFVEVKPAGMSDITSKEMEKCNRLASATSKNCVIVAGSPGDYEAILIQRSQYLEPHEQNLPGLFVSLGRGGNCPLGFSSKVGSNGAVILFIGEPHGANCVESAIANAATIRF